jgi:glycosyltransferase involved in cell wall biosynthesis
MRISCVVPVHNAEPYLVEALDSVLSQGWPDIEVIVVNDGSTDGSPKILERYRDAVTRIDQEQAGISAARNSGLRHASGDLIAFQDADDIWPPGRLAAMAGALRDDPTADVAAGRVEIIDERPAGRESRKKLETVHRLMLVQSLLIRRSVFDRIGPFNDQLRAAEDIEFIMRARARSISFNLVDVVSLRYRLHAGNISGDIATTHFYELEVMHTISSSRRRASS